MFLIGSLAPAGAFAPVSFSSVVNNFFHQSCLRQHKNGEGKWLFMSKNSKIRPSEEQIITPQSWSKPQPQLNDIEFWGQPRTEEEIIDFCAKTLFSISPIDDNLTAYKEQTQNTSSNIQVINAEPPLVIIHNFLSNEMCQEIINAAISVGDFKRSSIGAKQETSNHRTSSTTWLREEHCKIPLRFVANRVARLSCLPAINMENLQVVKYEPGQKFDLHTDHLDSFNDLECRGRLATCLLYLNSAEDKDTERGDTEGLESREGTDESNFGEESLTNFRGGETQFPEFNADIVPKRGSAVFWFNTVERPGSNNYDSEMFLNVDTRLRHSGLPVLKGEKWVCNRWIHPVPLNAGVKGD